VYYTVETEEAVNDGFSLYHFLSVMKKGNFAFGNASKPSGFGAFLHWTVMAANSSLCFTYTRRLSMQKSTSSADTLTDTMVSIGVMV
jgi:hypothetical protein